MVNLSTLPKLITTGEGSSRGYGDTPVSPKNIFDVFPPFKIVKKIQVPPKIRKYEGVFPKFS